MRSGLRAPFAGLADVALPTALAAAALAGASNRFNSAGPLSIDNLTAPAAVVVAAGLIRPKASGLFFFAFQLDFALSAAATTQLACNAVYPATGITGGATVPNTSFHYRSGSPVVPAGALGTTVIGVDTNWQIATGNIAAVSLSLTGFVAVPLRTTAALEILATNATNMTGISLFGGYYELP